MTDNLYDEIAQPLLDGLDGAQAEEAQQLTDELIADWRREAGSGDDAPGVLAILKQDLFEAAQGRAADERLELLRGQTAERAIDRLGARSLDLGERVLAGDVDDEAAREEGRAIMDEASRLSPRVQGLRQGDVAQRLKRDLSEINLEALYAVERKAMSHRLSHIARDAGKGDGPPPPRTH